jgi:hypothetical protein
MRRDVMLDESRDRADSGGRQAPGPSLAELLGRTRAGDQAAWDGIVERYCQLVWGVIGANGLTGADAADTSEVTWLLLGQHLDEQEPGRLGHWLAATATREAAKTRLLRAAETRAVPA